VIARPLPYLARSLDDLSLTTINTVGYDSGTATQTRSYVALHTALIELAGELSGLVDALDLQQRTLQPRCDRP
jgi:hypothetical protein